MITEAIKAIFDAINSGFTTVNTCKEHQAETDVIKTKKKKSKAIEYAEKIIFLADETELKDNRTYKRYRKLFFKYN